MRLSIVFAALMAAGAKASSIPARQFGFGSGTINIYSSPGCHPADMSVEEFAVTGGCVRLDKPAASVKFMSASGASLFYIREY